MPWTETRIMDERVKFISEVLQIHLASGFARGP